MLNTEFTRARKHSMADAVSRMRSLPVTINWDRLDSRWIESLLEDAEEGSVGSVPEAWVVWELRSMFFLWRFSNMIPLSTHRRISILQLVTRLVTRLVAVSSC